MSEPKIETIEKAGVVAFTPGGNVLICTSLTDMSKWVLPKGHCEKGEPHYATAIREAEEELGWSVALIDPDPVGDYTLLISPIEEDDMVYEHVVFFMAEIKDRTGEGERPILQCPVLQALQILTYSHAKEILLQAIRFKAINDYIMEGRK